MKCWEKSSLLPIFFRFSLLERFDVMLCTVEQVLSSDVEQVLCSDVDRGVTIGGAAGAVAPGPVGLGSP